MPDAKAQHREGIVQEKAIQHGVRQVTSQKIDANPRTTQQPGGMKRETNRRKPYDPSVEGY